MRKREGDRPVRDSSLCSYRFIKQGITLNNIKVLYNSALQFNLINVPHRVSPTTLPLLFKIAVYQRTTSDRQ